MGLPSLSEWSDQAQAPGPAMLPEEVLGVIREELFDWRGTGMSVMELPHRGQEFKQVIEESEKDLRELLQIPANYHVLFLQGGGRLQFSMVPLNLLESDRTAVYLDSGRWARLALEEARIYTDVHVAAEAQTHPYSAIPDPSSWSVPQNTAYFYYVDNETADGIELPFIPDLPLPVVCDMSSNFTPTNTCWNRQTLAFFLYTAF